MYVSTKRGQPPQEEQATVWIVANRSEGVIATRPTHLAAKAAAFERYLSPRETRVAHGLYKVFSHEGVEPVYVMRVTPQMVDEFVSGRRKVR